MEVGRALRRRRETLGYTLEDVRAATKIRLRYLQALEDERLDALPAPVYTRGFIRSYANFLDLDGAALAAAWGQATQPADAASEAPPEAAASAREVHAPASSAEASGPARVPRPVGAASTAGRPEVPLRQRPVPRPLGRRRLPVVALWLVALIAIVAAAYVWQAASHGAGSTAPAQAAATATATATGSASAHHSTTATTPAATAPPVPSLTASTGVDSAGNPLTTFRVAGASGLTVVARASARCWVRVWLDGSTTYADQTLLPGQSATWRAHTQLRMRIGYPSGLHLTVDGLAAPAFSTINPVDAAVILATPTP